jgi:hypothetical protein
MAASCQARGPAPRAITLTVDTRHPGRALPRDYLGLSFEASVLGSTWFNPQRSNLPNLLRDLGVGSLRFGGNSLDRVTAWTADPATRLPAWAHARVTPDDLRRLGALAQATGWQVDLGVTLGHPDAIGAASEVAAASRLMGPGLRTVQIGNEPDLLPGYNYARYRADLAAYRTAIEAAVPGVRFSGPDTAGAAWLNRFRQDDRAPVSFLTQHFYPLTRCGGRHPGIAELLAPQAATAPIAAGIRLDETNSASCGGQDGVSNTLASALWVVNYLLNSGRQGIAGVNVHGGLAACRGYSPLCVPGATGPDPATAPGVEPIADLSLGAAPNIGGQLTVQPDFYGLLLVHQLEGGRWLAVHSDRSLPFSSFALLMPGGEVRVVLVNTSATRTWPVKIGGGFGPGTAVRLTGPSLSATGGVRLGGGQVAADGTFVLRAGEPVNPSSVDLPPASAVVLTLPALR